MKKIPQRTCVGCNEIKNKKELIRIVKNKENQINIGDKIDGRGVYLCPNLNCLEKAIKNKRIEKKLEMKIDNKIYESLRGVIVDK